MKVTVERLITGALLACAITVTALLMRRELSSQSVSIVSDAPVMIDRWSELLEAGVPFGPRGGPVSIAVFSDFQCPFCRLFHETLREARKEYGDQIMVTYLHYPLSYHEHAMRAALASECADRQGRFEQFADAMFARQDSLGILSWTEFATTAEIPDGPAFDDCVRELTAHDRVTAGRKLAREIGAGGTPTVLINGWRLPGAPDLASLRTIVDDILAGRDFPSPSS